MTLLSLIMIPGLVCAGRYSGDDCGSEVVLYQAGPGLIALCPSCDACYCERDILAAILHYHRQEPRRKQEAIWDRLKAKLRSQGFRVEITFSEFRPDPSLTLAYKPSLETVPST